MVSSIAVDQSPQSTPSCLHGNIAVLIEKIHCRSIALQDSLAVVGLATCFVLLFPFDLQAKKQGAEGQPEEEERSAEEDEAAEEEPEAMPDTGEAPPVAEKEEKPEAKDAETSMSPRFSPSLSLYLSVYICIYISLSLSIPPSRLSLQGVTVKRQSNGNWYLLSSSHDDVKCRF